ncbi:MAG: PD40 domain-containing protein [Anaerolineae bacterium]|nr:PD40 domain-containing protein [Anaerolineae bacterium]
MTKDYCPLLTKLNKQHQSASVAQPIALLVLVFFLASCQVTPLVRQDGNPAANPSGSGTLDRLPMLFTEPGTTKSSTLVAPPNLPAQDTPRPDANSTLMAQRGEAIAFVSERREAGNLDIWLIDTATNLTTEVTSDEAQDTQPRWSPDGRYLAFRSAWPDYHSTIRIYDFGTGELNELDPGDHPYDFDWLRDEPGLVYSNGDFQIRYLYLDGKTSDVIIERGRAPVVSPDGGKIAYIASGPEITGERLAVFSRGSELVDFAIDDPSNPERGYTLGSFDWSSSGQRIVEARQGSRISVPFVVVYDAHLESLASLPIGYFLESSTPGYGANLCSPSWLDDSDGVIFVFQSNDSDGMCVGQIYAAGGNLQEIHKLVQGNDFASPVVSPDGINIAANRGHGDVGSVENSIHFLSDSSIWIMDRDGSNLRLLTDGPGYDGEAVWRPLPANQ